MKCQECETAANLRIRVENLGNTLVPTFVIFACWKHLPAVLRGMALAAQEAPQKAEADLAEAKTEKVCDRKVEP